MTRIHHRATADTVRRDLEHHLSGACLKAVVLAPHPSWQGKVSALELLVTCSPAHDLDCRLVELAAAEVIHLSQCRPNVKQFVHCRTGLAVTLRVVPLEGWTLALILATRSRAVRRRLQQAASDKGYQLSRSEGTLQRPDGTPANLPNERAAFRLLGVPWTPARGSHASN